MSTRIKEAKRILQDAMLDDFFEQIKQMMQINEFRYVRLVPTYDLVHGEIFFDLPVPDFNVEIITTDDLDTQPDEIDDVNHINALMEQAGMPDVEDMLLAQYMDSENCVVVTPSTTLLEFKAQFSQTS